MRQCHARDVSGLMSHRPVRVIYKERSEIEKMGYNDRRVCAAGDALLQVRIPFAVRWAEARVEGLTRNRNGGIGE